MKIVRCLLVAAIVFSLSFGMFPCRARAQETPEERQSYEDTLIAYSLIQAMSPFSQKLLDHFSLVHNVQVDMYNYESQVKRLYPKSYKYFEDQLSRERGLVNTSLPGFRSASQPGVGLIGISWAIATLVFEINFFRDRGETRKKYCREDLMSGPSPFTSLQADQECNWQSDQMVDMETLLYAVVMPGGVAALGIARIYEWARVSGRRYPVSWYFIPGRYARGGPQNQYKPPGGTMSGGPCGSPAGVYEGGLTGEKPGTGLPTFDGGVINVIAKDPCRSGGQILEPGVE